MKPDAQGGAAAAAVPAAVPGDAPTAAPEGAAQAQLPAAVAEGHEEEAQDWRMHRMVSSIEELNTRIARLALGLGVSLKSDADLDRLMSRHHAPAAPGGHPHILDQPMENQWQELRGLLVLRYGIETQYVDQVGVVAARQILVEAEEHLLRRGFNLGDDGIDQKLLFDKP